MPGIHKNNTVSFRPSEWEKIMIDQRAKLSGLTKKNFIIRSCIYSNICVVGDKRHIQRIVDSIQDMTSELRWLASSLNAGELLLSDDGFEEMKKQYIAFCIAMVEILNGASYLFTNNDAKVKDVHKNDRLKELLETLGIDNTDL